jgi:NAD(P)-dependent dehydrogenase (short-subunit alcohol dehydrogenase family)
MPLRPVFGQNRPLSARWAAAIVAAMSADRRLTGRRALVTGGAAGIGAATAARLAAEGADVLVVDTRVPEGGNAPPVRLADVTDPAQIADAVRAAAGTGGLDICVANAGVSLMEPFLDGSVESWGRVLQVNLLGVMITLQAAAHAMVAAGRGGRLLATASIAGLHGEPGGSAYCASKAGVVGLVRTLAVELAPFEITVNAVAPGQIDTDMNSRDLETQARELGRAAEHLRQEQLERNVPARRLGTPDEVASLFAFLASDEAAFITGEVLRIDGGELAS